MPKLPALTPKRVIKLLKDYGFQLDHSTGGHFVFYHPETRRRVTVPVHNKDLPKGTLLSIMRQAGLSKDFLSGL